MVMTFCHATLADLCKVIPTVLYDINFIAITIKVEMYPFRPSFDC